MEKDQDEGDLYYGLKNLVSQRYGFVIFAEKDLQIVKISMLAFKNIIQVSIMDI